MQFLTSKSPSEKKEDAQNLAPVLSWFSVPTKEGTKGLPVFKWTISTVPWSLVEAFKGIESRLALERANSVEEALQFCRKLLNSGGMIETVLPGDEHISEISEEWGLAISRARELVDYLGNFRRR